MSGPDKKTEDDEYWWLDDEFDIGAWSWIDEIELYGYEKDEKKDETQEIE